MRTLIVEEKEGILTNAFKQNQLFSVTTQHNLHLLSQVDVQAVIVDEKAISFSLLLEKLAYLDGLSYLFYIMRENNQEIEDLCRAKQIISIVATNETEAYEKIKQIAFADDPKRNQLFLFLGADHKVGTTSVVHSVAQHLAGEITKKVLVVSLSSRTNDTFIEVSKSSIDHLRTSITSRVITFSELYRESEKIKNYQFIAGPRDMVRSRSYSIEDIVNVIEILKKQDEYIVLIDGGNDLDSPLTMAAIQRVKNRLMVMKNTQSYYRQLDQKINQVLKPHPHLQLGFEAFLYIINHHDETTDNVNGIRERNGICVATLPKSKYGETAEDQFTTLYAIDDNFRQKVDVLTNIIASKTGYKREEVVEKKSIFKRMFNGKRGEIINGVSS